MNGFTARTGTTLPANCYTLPTTTYQNSVKLASSVEITFEDGISRGQKHVDRQIQDFSLLRLLLHKPCLDEEELHTQGPVNA